MRLLSAFWIGVGLTYAMLSLLLMPPYRPISIMVGVGWCALMYSISEGR